ncbi:hypothetical protein MIZ03_1408 [Rhodoferax lithotrophicus]|uniref:Uncharacterized protein n=1 Tax=Rhodoferax lithotrophicus TaxID=2798804 RepID=A0ABN6D3G6_9BURK|nr:hypothetical protein MIZ03_1408 [Rhodoferax sp. MIZ03]
MRFADFGLGDVLRSASKPGLAPAGDSLSFASPKESKQRKGEPTVCVPSLRYGQPAVLAAGGGPLELATLKQSRALIHLQLRSSAQPEGPEGQRTAKSKRLVAWCATSPPARAKQSAATLPAVEAGLSSAADCGKRAGDCLSEASSSQPPQSASSARNRVAALPSARLFFAYFLLAKQKKVSGRRATPAYPEYSPTGEN